MGLLTFLRTCLVNVALGTYIALFGLPPWLHVAAKTAPSPQQQLRPQQPQLPLDPRHAFAQDMRHLLETHYPDHSPLHNSILRTVVAALLDHGIAHPDAQRQILSSLSFIAGTLVHEDENGRALTAALLREVVAAILSNMRSAAGGHSLLEEDVVTVGGDQIVAIPAFPDEM